MLSRLYGYNNSFRFPKISGKLSACANSGYQALSFSAHREPGYEANVVPYFGLHNGSANFPEQWVYMLLALTTTMLWWGALIWVVAHVLQTQIHHLLGLCIVGKTVPNVISTFCSAAQLASLPKTGLERGYLPSPQGISIRQWFPVVIRVGYMHSL